MSQSIDKKSIMKLLGIEQMINQYQNQYVKKPQQIKSSLANKNRSRYSSALENDGSTRDKSMRADCLRSKLSTDKNGIKITEKQIFVQKSDKKVRNHLNKSKYINYKSQLHDKKGNNISSGVNLIKQQPQKNNLSYKKTLSKRNKLQATQLVNFNSVSSLKQSFRSKQTSKHESYLNLKERKTEKPKNLSKIQIDFQSPILQCINRKIRQFQKKIYRNQDNKTHLNKDKGTQPSQQDIHMNKQSAMRHSQTLQIKKQSQSEQHNKFVSIDTNYYGFSFKNKIPLKVQKVEYKNQSFREVSSTLDKSSLENQGTKTDGRIDDKISISTLKVQRTQQKKTQSTITHDKINSRYLSTSMLNKKKPNSCLLLRPNVVLKERYQLVKVIGRGMSGQVYQAKDILSDRYVAIKQIKVDSIEYDFFREIQHQNIIRYYNNFIQNNKRYLVLEYFPLTLKDLLKDIKAKATPTEQDVKHIFKSILNGLSYLHSLSIAHRDIKLDNIVVSSNLEEIKFIDFGLCMDLSKIQDGLSRQFCGTLSYLSPEIIQAMPHQPKKADIWSLGIVLYAILVGRLPYKGKNQNQILTKICKNKLIFPQNFDSNLKELIEGMLKKNPAKRYTLSQILSHKWLS